MKTWPLQQAPYGLLGALGLKQSGQNPDGFSAELAVALDAMPFYMVPEVIQQVTIVTTPLADGSLVSLTVPDNEAWLVYGHGGSLPLLAGDTFVDQAGLYTAYQQNVNTPALQLATGPTAPKGLVVVTTMSLEVGTVFAQPFIAPPKALFLTRVSGSMTLAANRNMQSNVLAYRIRTP